MFRKIILIMAMATATSTYAYTGAELLPFCKEAVKLADVKGNMPISVIDAANVGKCLGYVEAMIDYNVLFRAANFSGDVTYCPPPGTDVEKDVRIIVKYFEDNTKLLDTPANTLTMKALRQAFPCKNAK